jgi:drug/metabolite transporter (DMT)-like permease
LGIKEPHEKKQTLTYLAAMATILMWSSAFPGTRYLLQYYSPGSIMLLRFIVAVVIMVVIGIVRKIRLPKIKDLPLFAAFGICGIFLYNFFFNTGTVNVAAGVSSFIVASSPVFTLILSRLLLKEIVKPACWVGVALSFCGLVVVMLSQTTGFALNAGVLLLLCAAASGSILNITQRKLVKTYTVFETTTYAMLIGTVCMLVYIPDIMRELPESTLAVNLTIVYMAIFPAILAYISWGYALSKAEKTTHVTVFLYLVPFIASLLGFFWLGETFSLVSLFGGVVIVAGVVVTNLLGR